MKCCVGTCTRAAKWAVTFNATRARYFYCGWHALDRNGAQRWPESAAHLEKI